MANLVDEQVEIDSDSYRVKLEGIKNIGDFEGPLDLLLHLIKQAKIDIKDIFVSEVTEQFLRYMENLEDLDMDKASEFLEVAATLLEIKSKALLPRIEEETDGEEDEGRKLIRQLEEYKLFKELSEKLKESEQVGVFYKEPDESAFKTHFVLKDMDMDGLLDAFSKLIAKLERRGSDTTAPKQIKKDTFTVRQKIEFIKDVVVKKNRTTFFELFSEDYTKVEVITTFQALLELLKLQIVYAEQSDAFSDIVISLKDGALELLNEPIEIEE